MAFYILSYWILDIFFESKLSGFIIIVTFIVLNFICSFVSFILGNKDFLFKGNAAASSNTRGTVADKPKNDFGLHQMFAKPKYIFLILAFFIVEGLAYNF